MVMKRTWWLLGCSAPLAVGLVLGCNGLLGIGPASLESDDGGTPVTATRGLTCPYYCQTIVQNCTQANAEFLGSEDPTQLCLSMCPAFDVGTSIAATNDDTLGCRIYYAEQSASDPTNCRFAGVMGGGTCGTDACQLFCSLDVTYCNSASVSTPAYSSQSACLAACSGDGGYPYLTADASDLLDSTNTLNCRFWHLENANGSVANGQFHCPHTEQMSSLCK
jgi:hypothetical protein